MTLNSNTNKKEPRDVLSSNQALQLLWVLEKENDKFNMEFTKDELSYLRLSVLDGWGSLTTPYVKHLVSTDKLETLSRMSNNLPLFK